MHDSEVLRSKKRFGPRSTLNLWTIERRGRGQPITLWRNASWWDRSGESQYGCCTSLLYDRARTGCGHPSGFPKARPASMDLVLPGALTRINVFRPACLRLWASVSKSRCSRRDEAVDGSSRDSHGTNAADTWFRNGAVLSAPDADYCGGVDLTIALMS